MVTQTLLKLLRVTSALNDLRYPHIGRLFTNTGLVAPELFIEDFYVSAGPYDA
jgi:hypothetical protein